MKETIKDIKLLNKAVTVGSHTLDAGNRVKTRATSFASGKEASAREYAQENLQGA